MVKSPPLSVVVTSYTMERFSDLCDLFDSIKEQTILKRETEGTAPGKGDSSAPSPLEVVFVAERSRELMERVREYGEQIGLPSFKVVYNDGEPGLSAARNLGILNSSGEIIAFVDDDVILHPQWAEEVLKGFDDNSVIGVTGPALPLWEDEKSMSWFPEEFSWIISCTNWFKCQEKREVRNAWGHNMAFRREVFRLCGLFDNDFGFHKGLYAEDNEFSLRARASTGRSIVFCPDMAVWHRIHKYRIGFKFMKERAYWIGRSRRSLRSLHGKGERNLLREEEALLRRIFTSIPKSATLIIRRPRDGFRRLYLTGVALSFVTLGYLSSSHTPTRHIPSQGTG